MLCKEPLHPSPNASKAQQENYYTRSFNNTILLLALRPTLQLVLSEAEGWRGVGG